MLPKSTTDGHTTLSQTGKVVGFSNSSSILGVTDLIYNVGFEHLGWQQETKVSFHTQPSVTIPHNSFTFTETRRRLKIVRARLKVF